MLDLPVLKHNSLKVKQDAWLTPAYFLPSKIGQNRKKAVIRRKISETCAKLHRIDFSIIFRKSQVLARRSTM